MLDRELRIPENSQLLRTARDLPLLIFTTNKASRAGKRCEIEALGAEVIELPCADDGLDLTAVLEELGRRRIVSVIVEGGSETAGAFIGNGLVDKATFFFAPRIIGGRDAVSAVGGPGIAALNEAPELRDVQLVRRGSDWEVTGYFGRST